MLCAGIFSFDLEEEDKAVWGGGVTGGLDCLKAPQGYEQGEEAGA